MRFRLQDRDGQDVLGGEVEEGNVYISAYGKLIDGIRPTDLNVGEMCRKEFSLSGQKPTTYWIVRTQ